MQSVLVKERKLSELFPEVINNENERELFDNARIQNINVYKKSRKLEIFIVSDTLIPAKTLDSEKTVRTGAGSSQGFLQCGALDRRGT